ncbi:hypothetical protein ACKKBG_A06560 [Auxenochlorella protothecoides x Auxenochlorella symbiontica]|uniref:Uncharacterized protein n=1 Tax=Auxenochlorella protothecoides TaxID=3075 RepID=A0A1D2A1K4_AUXPR
MTSIWHKVAAVGGATAVAAGAYGSHGLAHLAPTYRTVFETANKYHMIHGGILMALAPIARRPNLVGGFSLAGTLLFSGSCYVVALTEDRSFGKLAPIGGFLLMGAWISLAL